MSRGSNMPYLNDFSENDDLSYDDDELEELRKLARRKPASEGIYNDFINSRPERSNYNPSFGRKLAGTLLGALSKDPGKTASDFVNRDYLTDRERWLEERPLVNQRAARADAAQKDDIQVEEFGIRQKAQKRAKFNQAEKEFDKENKRIEEKLLTDAERKERNAKIDKSRELSDKLALERNERSKRAEGRSIERFNRGKTPKKFEYQDSPSRALRESDADEELRNKAKANVLANPALSNYFVSTVTTDDKGNKVTRKSMIEGIPGNIKAKIMSMVEDEYNSLLKKGRREVPFRSVDDEYPVDDEEE